MLVAYDPTWPATFVALRSVYVHALGDAVLAVEHVGSTAVPGLVAKPVIDIDLVVAPHAALGYRHVGDQGIAGREVFKRGDRIDVPADGTDRSWPAHHLYACAPESTELRRHLVFRDWLRARPEHAAAYAALTQQLAATHDGDRERYTEGKTAFVEAALLDAR